MFKCRVGINISLIFGSCSQKLLMLRMLLYFLLYFCISYQFVVVDGFKPEIIEALMVESLRNNLVQACDNEKITLHCPRNTHILIQNAFYGRLVPSAELCPNPQQTTMPSTTTTKKFDGSSTSPSVFSEFRKSNFIHQQRKPHYLQEEEDTSCDVTDAHMKIIEVCRNKRKCRIDVHPTFFGDHDPCPTTSKYLQISYKCKPISFEDQNFCEGTNMQLNCKQNKRLSIYSAQYGRTVNGQGMMNCGAFTEPILEDCVGDVLPQILKKCHAQTDCSIGINDHFLGSACANGVQKYLSLIYMCVNEEVFSEAAIKGTMDSMKDLEEELKKKEEQQKNAMASSKNVKPFKKPLNNLLTSQKNKGFDEDYGLENDELQLSQVVAVNGYDSLMERRPIVNQNSLVEQTKNDAILKNDEKIKNAKIGNDFFGLIEFIKENQERSLLYFFLSVAGAIILLLLFCIIYQCRNRESKSDRLFRQHSANLFHNNSSCRSSAASGSGRNFGRPIPSSSSKFYEQVQTVTLPRPSTTTTKMTTARSGVGSAELSSLVDSRCGSNHTTSPLYLEDDEGDSRAFGPLRSTIVNGYCSSGSGTSVHNSMQNGYAGSALTFGSGHYMRFSHIPTPPRIPSGLHYYS